MGQIVFAFTEVKCFEDAAGFLEATGFAYAGVGERQGDIVDDGQAWDEVEILKDEADVS